ncbi:SDR family NAD(P)-dependent oxidoreductase [Spirosoma sp. HMF4905]|uniref:SDR family NAD(P)-dependent oxidoreductase n=2 Tax=Spirosoma arboris TaxID=2682092 RepID=A0A7K1SAT1_9BACT|nr:SDR family NAD(P)-dependent oxidoreductase [Spirosoma arboris]
MQPANKTIVVTGAGSGIGRELTLQLLRKGANVAGVDINQNALSETQQLAGVGDERFKGYVLDITDQARVENFPTEVITHFGAVDGLINNAGIIQPFKPVNELTFDQINRVMQVNFYGTVYLTKAFLPHFLQRPEAHIVNVSSMGGFIPFPGQTLYGAAKAAVKIFTEGLHAELADTAVRVTVVHPGAIATNITANSGLPGPKVDPNAASSKMALSASKAADIIIRAMEKNKYRVTVGKDATLLDILYRLSPKRASRFIGKMMKKTLSKM